MPAMLEGPWNHERNPHCCGCWVIRSDERGPYAKCNECGERRNILPLLEIPSENITRYDENGNESPDGLLVFYSDYDALELRARSLVEQLEAALAAVRDVPEGRWSDDPEAIYADKEDWKEWRKAHAPVIELAEKARPK